VHQRPRAPPADGLRPAAMRNARGTHGLARRAERDPGRRAGARAGTRARATVSAAAAAAELTVYVQAAWRRGAERKPAAFLLSAAVGCCSRRACCQLGCGVPLRAASSSSRQRQQWWWERSGRWPAASAYGCSWRQTVAAQPSARCRSSWRRLRGGCARTRASTGNTAGAARWRDRCGRGRAGCEQGRPPAAPGVYVRGSERSSSSGGSSRRRSSASSSSRRRRRWWWQRGARRRLSRGRAGCEQGGPSSLAAAGANDVYVWRRRSSRENYRACSCRGQLSCVQIWRRRRRGWLSVFTARRGGDCRWSRRSSSRRRRRRRSTRVYVRSLSDGGGCSCSCCGGGGGVQVRGCLFPTGPFYCAHSLPTSSSGAGTFCRRRRRSSEGSEWWRRRWRVYIRLSSSCSCPFSCADGSACV
jgi:hypothetical protein